MQILVALSCMGSCKPVKKAKKGNLDFESARLSIGCVYVKPNFASTCGFVREAGFVMQQNLQKLGLMKIQLVLWQ